MNRIQSSFMSIEQVKGTYLDGDKRTNRLEHAKQQELSFRDILEQAGAEKEQVQEVIFSKHANDRLLSRNISLDDGQIERLNKGVMQAKEKNINESLVMMDNIAFIVNIGNNTVITAMDQKNNDSNVFTNIDGAVIV